MMNTNFTSINFRLRKMGVRIRKASECNFINVNINEIKDLYFNQGKNLLEIEKLMGVSISLIGRRLKKEGLILRKGGFKKGEEHLDFNNWSSREPYGKDFSPKLKEQIRKRDNYTCQECNKHQEKFKSKLSIHHIDYNKQNNNPLNLISLCNKCHLKTNKNRKHWEKYFKNIMVLREIFNPDNLLIFNENKKLIGMERMK